MGRGTMREFGRGMVRSWGNNAWMKESSVYLPQPDTVEAWLIARPRAKPTRLDLREPGSGPQIAPFNGYTGDGNVTADVIYVNYGLIEDYKTLDSLGLSVGGKVGLARDCPSLRGIK